MTWRTNSNRVFRGFRFKITDLPKEYRVASRWRSYLFTNRIPGYVLDDVSLQDALKQFPAKVLCKQWAVDMESIEEIADAAEVGRYGWYSFNPNYFEECHNCVTWAIFVVNRVLADVLPLIPNGRIKLAVQMLIDSGAHPSA